MDFDIEMEGNSVEVESLKIIINDLVNHLFLPKRLPHSENEDMPQVEQALLEHHVRISSLLLHQSGLNNTKQTLSAWMRLQSSPSQLDKSLESLKQGESACLYVRKQNCTIVFTKISEEHMRVITFRSSFPNKEVTSTEGSLKVTYPETMDVVPISSLLLSPCFSRQLEHLISNICHIAMPMSGKNFIEKQEPSYPYVICDFLVGMLCPVDPDEFGKMADMDSIKFQKKLRDQVNWDDFLLPWRRSGLWMSAKVILQLSLQEEMTDKEDAYLVYKLIILEVLTFFGAYYVNMGDAYWDTSAQIMAKLARRAKKIAEMKISKSINLDLTALRQEVLDRTREKFDEIHALISEQWSKIAMASSRNLQEVCTVIRSNQDWYQDCIHCIPELSDYLNGDPNPGEPEEIDSLKIIDPVIQTQMESLADLLNRAETSSSQQQDVHLNDESVWLYQVEWFVRNGLHEEQPSGKIFNLLKFYVSKAFKLYENSCADPVYFSRLVITVLKFVAILDKIAVAAHPLLIAYTTGIQPEMFHCLLIPEKCEMKLGEELLIYFDERNKNAQIQEWWLANSSVGLGDFPARFAQGDQGMQKLKQDILDQMELDIEAKKEEINRVENECRKLEKSILITRCGKTFRSSGVCHRTRGCECQRCSMVYMLKQKKVSVPRYQAPLPPQNDLRDAVVFELRIPLEISVLRESVFILLEDILGCKQEFLAKTSGMAVEWVQFTELQRWSKTGHQVLVHLGSRTKDKLTLLSQTSRKGKSASNPDVLRSLPSDFVVQNGLGCTYFRTSLVNTDIPNLFTMKIEDPSYQSLQFALDRQRPTENEVISKQYICHQNVTLKEFKTFGTLRSAHLVQLRNLYAGIASQLLSIEKEPVLQLIMQTLWELGPGNREIHVDFDLAENKQFSMAFLKMLRNSFETNASNWNNPICILSLVIVTVRILEMNELLDVKENAAKLLQEIRAVLEKWCKKLETLLVKTTDINDTKMLMDSLLKCAICTMFTFNASTPEIMPYIFKDPSGSDVTFYLKALFRLHHLVVRENILRENPASGFTKNMVRHARYAVPLNAQPYLHKILLNVSFNSGIHGFVCSKWCDAVIHDNDIPVFKHSGRLSRVKKHAYQAEYTISGNGHRVCVDILRGTFFVDGHPPSVLPESIVRNPLYRSFFSTCHFRVQRDSQTFKTTDKYRGHHYEFTEVQNRLIIRQMGSGDGHWFELLPRKLLGDKVARDLISNYTHWYDSQTKDVYFRRVSASDVEGNNIEEDTDYLLVQSAPSSTSQGKDQWCLRKYIGRTCESSSYLLSIHSTGFLVITNNLKRLEHKNFVHVYLDKDKSDKCDGRVSANLWRFNLSFALNHTDGLLYSEIYTEFYIPTTENGGQNLKTLIGLHSGIVLEKRTVAEPSGVKKIFLIQHGTLQISSSEEKHQSVAVMMDAGTRNPPYFVYEVDQILMRLHPPNSKSAFLFLAALHGSTSSPFPDPFTRLTGTEMAIWTLQCAFSWSCSPYDSECLNILTQISAMSPEHRYYNKGMQKTQWPTGLLKNSYAAYDGYALLVDQLLEDSVRLEGLFPGQNSGSRHTRSPTLCKRSYCRNINFYNKVAYLTDKCVEDVYGVGGSLTSHIRSNENTSLATLAEFRRNGITASNNEEVANLIMNNQPLHSNLADTLTEGYLTTWLATNLRYSWLQLYSSVLSKRKIEHELTLIFGAMLYSGLASLPQLLDLHNIAVNHNHGMRFPEPVKSSFGDFTPTDNKFVSSSIRSILEEAADAPPTEQDYSTHQQYMVAVSQYNSSLEKHLNSATKSLAGLFPIGSIGMRSLQKATSRNSPLNVNKMVLDEINANFRNWYNNRNLALFISKVACMLAGVKIQARARDLNLIRPTKWQINFVTVADTLDEWTLEDNILELEQEGPQTGKLQCTTERQIFVSGHLKSAKKSSSTFDYQRRQCLQLVDRITKNLNGLVLENSSVSEGLAKAGLQKRLAPVVLLRDHVGRITTMPPLTKGVCFVGALAVVWAHLKRLNRIMLYDSDKKKYSVELRRELESHECENWNPFDNPEWLLLELELDITIRSVQVEVAKRMMDMPGKNGVMQLNMGEGKTSVIIPMIVATLSGKNLLCRVTVLNSIFATNYNLLGFTIGRFLNKRLYTVPCCRDLNIDVYLDQIKSIYNECEQMAGAVITLPEYTLSFRLQMYNRFLQDGKEDVGLKIYEIESWLRKHARDLLDESDEIFSVKYQLIYSTGIQQHTDGGSMRWSTCQKMMELLPEVATELLKKHGTNAIEFHLEKAQEYPEQFTHFRMLNDECKADLNELVAERILNGRLNFLGRLLREDEKKIVKEFMINENISEVDHKKLQQIDIPLEKQLVVLLVSGYLRRGIFFGALKKRWRVEYGVKQARKGITTKLMAVPFRAKDVAAERTEFGHPDMAIVLTQLSYYYSGLTDDQLLQCFQVLETDITGPESIYDSWIKKIPSSRIKSEAVKYYKGINLQDYEQRTGDLFSLLRKHKDVVDFWLENVAYPKECKEFPRKLVTNAWDLCHEKSDHPTAGFSGTNDTSLLLPAQISQQDLPMLSDTNIKMEETLKQVENQWRRSLRMGADCKEILELMIKDDLCVLIDAGALMLELRNEEIAQLWLELDNKLEAVVYFNVEGQMATKVRRQIAYRNHPFRERDQLLMLSPFKDSLENCAVYLDDQHTRGIDIKLPTHFKACVTVGSGMRRDKLIQACIRMRKLGKGQSVHFYLSHEVDNKIRRQLRREGAITVDDIISWAKQNSSQFEKDGLVYWATNARTYAKNLAADCLFELSAKCKEDWKTLANNVEDSNAQELQVMYGTYYSRRLLTELIPAWFLGIKHKLLGASDSALPDFIVRMLADIQVKVLIKCLLQVPLSIFSHNVLEEEQEKELEPEIEEEKEKHRPSGETPLLPYLHQNVRRCVTQMMGVHVMDGIRKLSDILKNTTVASKLQEDCWGHQLYATKDFIKVIETNGDGSGNDMDDFLKSIRFFVSFGKGNSSILILSLHEVNCLISSLRNRKCCPLTTLHMFAGRWMDKQPIFANDSDLQLPIRDYPGVQLHKNVLAPLLIAAGNLYFNDEEEERAFARFLGLRLQPWTDEEQGAFESNLITNSRFVLPRCTALRNGCSFQEDPTDMVMGVLKIRNEVLRDADHTVFILNGSILQW